ncbi:MAG: TolC family outer membrane protein, partial [Gammaproteobacteria bacterium]|nr:TolC family outer membrane protein [Gammaproteobacteria bacterium]
ANKPQVNLAANATYQDKGNSLTSDDKQSSAGLTLSLQQNLYNAEILAKTDAVEAQITQSEADYKAAQQDLIIRATEAYFNILSARDSVEFAQAEKNAIGRQLEQAKKRFEVGLIAITDVKEAQASYDFSLSQEIIADNTLDNARQALQVIIGQPLSGPLMPLGDGVQLVIPEPANASAWVEQAQKFNLNLASSQAGLRAANENRKIAKAANKPTVNLVASYQANTIDSDLSGGFDTNDLTLSVQLNMPLYTGGRTSGVISQSESDYATAQSNLLLQKRLTSQQTSNAYLAVVSGIGQVNALKQALVSTTAALEATEAGFDVGTRTSVDVLNSLRETYRSKRDYASSRYDYLINTLKLKQAAGLLNEEDIPAINQWLSN